MITLYNVISSDGYIARKDGDEDFIPNELWPSTLEFYKKYDAIVMGRKTYEAMQKYDRALLDPYEALDLKKIVITQNRSFVPESGYIVAHSPHDAFALVSGLNVLVSSGPELNSSVMRDGLVDKVIWQVVPVAIGEGIKPFDMDTESVLGESSTENGPLGTTIQMYRINNAHLLN